jgi:hypothetical protein
MPRRTKSELQAVARGKAGGAARTRAKVAAARANGALGGRPQTSLTIKVECASAAEAAAIRAAAAEDGQPAGEWLLALAKRELGAGTNDDT